MDTLTRIKIYQAFKAGYLKNVTRPIQQNDKQRAEYHAAAYVRKLKHTTT